MKREVLKIKYIGSDGKEQSFNNIEISDYTYKSDRMGSSKIEATVVFDRCLDKEWHVGKDYVTFNGENFYVQEIPSSSKDNKDVRYTHEVVFRSERELLNKVYFCDVVTPGAETANKPSTNSTTFAFYGNLREFINRLNCALKNAGIADSGIMPLITGDVKHFTPAGDGFYAIFDESGDYVDDSEKTKEVSFEDSYIWDAIETAYDTYEVPYQFDGKRIVFGAVPVAVDKTFKYGEKNELLSVTKTNANTKIVRRVAFKGSSENIPYYYPNFSEYGDYKIETTGGLNAADFSVVNAQKMFGCVDQREPITLCANYDKDTQFADVTSYMPDTNNHFYADQNTDTYEKITVLVKFLFTVEDEYVQLRLGDLDFEAYVKYPDNTTQVDTSQHDWTNVVKIKVDDEEEIKNNTQGNAFYDGYIFEKAILNGSHSVSFWIEIDPGYYPNQTPENPVQAVVYVKNIELFGYIKDTYFYWKSNNIIYRDIKSLGVQYNGTYLGEYVGSSFCWVAGEMIPVQSNLQAPIYRESGGELRFYEAQNNTYQKSDGSYYEFKNTYEYGVNDEYVYVDEDIKPTIEGIENASGQLIGSIADVAFDEDDNDELKQSSSEDSDTTVLNYKHSYFYIKLNIFDGEYGFNLFDQASQTGEMTINMTSGNCAGCNFIIQADEVVDAENGKTAYKNPVDPTNGTPVIKSGTYLDSQQDTQTNEVWICCKKDADTFGVIMPNQTHEYFPQKGDTFTITNIDLPDSYILAAEQKGKEAAIEYMSENNEERFTYEIAFSRIYFAENPDVLAQLNENSVIEIEYNKETKRLYVTSLSINFSDKDALPEISVELSEDLAVGDRFEQTIIDRVQSMIGSGTTMNNLATTANSGFFAGASGLIKTGDTTTPTNQNSFSSLMSDERYLRKDLENVSIDKDLIVSGQVQSRDNFTVGSFLTGQAQSGARIDKFGNAEMQSLTLWGSLSVPTLVFNRVTFSAGIRFDTFGGGEVESVTIDTDKEGKELLSGTITLKLERGEVANIAVDDLCVGIYHSYYGDNDTSSTDGRNGNFTFAGFKTVYFRITEILDTKTYGKFKYVLRQDDTWQKTTHPSQYMTFSCYGNSTDTNRQWCRIYTNKYSIGLKNMNTWQYGEANIYYIDGLLDGFSLSGKKFTGVGSVFGNVYIYGGIAQFDNEPLVMDINTNGDNFLAYGETLTVTVKVKKGWNDVTSSIKRWSLVRESGDAVEDAGWAAQDKVKAFCAKSGVEENTIVLSFDDLGTDENVVSTMFTFKAYQNDADEPIEAQLEI